MVFKDINYELVLSKRKTLAIEVKSGGAVVVRAPKRVKYTDIEAFLKSRYEWLLDAIERQKHRQSRYDISEEEVLQLRELAKKIIPQRVEYFSSLMGLKPTAVRINSAKTRFGSCSSKNSLNFSLYLMQFPLEAVDYVIVHELAHIKHKNHQKEFYDLVASYLPDYKSRVAILKK